MVNNIDVYKDIQKYHKLKPNWIKTDNVDVSLALSHDEKKLYLTYDVLEPELRREASFHNDRVWTDSCVEVFLKRADSSDYYNFECSASLWMLVGKGAVNTKRNRFDAEKIDLIERNINILEKENGRFHYTVSFKIDLINWGLLKEEENIEDLKLTGNFYKCGDDLKEPHFLSYFEMDKEVRNFHNPDCFGQINFL